MPTIYDNLENRLLDALRETLAGARRADFCAGYFNLRGWGAVADAAQQLPGDGENICRLIVGMPPPAGADQVRQLYGGRPQDPATVADAARRKREAADGFRRQLMLGAPANADRAALRSLRAQLTESPPRLRVKLFTRHPLHAKLHLVRRDDPAVPVVAYLGSSNLTLAGLQSNGELNVDVTENDAAAKLARWFEDRWNDRLCLDITDILAEVIDDSWAGKLRDPHHIYIKTAWHLSREEMEAAENFAIPAAFQDKLLPFQASAVRLAAQRLNRPERGVVVGDVVGLGKTLIAAAVAKTFQEDRDAGVLVICPPRLIPMWDEHLQAYDIAGRTLSLGRARDLEKMRRYPLVVVDESHNLRNRESARHARAREYIRKHDAAVVLLTATPYNKEVADLTSQLRLFLDPEADLGVRPESEIRRLGGAAAFKAKHAAPPSSLAAFEKSEQPDDLRELMRRFMIRRTRAHIRAFHAKKDGGREYLEFGAGEKYYFPRRVVGAMKFPRKRPDDPYEKLFSDQVARVIENLNLPRYGLKPYLREDAAAVAAPGEDQIINNLNRAGRRLLGFARTGLFKRLESGGDAFLISVRRHIIRNAAFLAALRDGEKLPVGRPATELLDAAIADGDDGEIFAGEEGEEDGMGGMGWVGGVGVGGGNQAAAAIVGADWPAFMNRGRQALREMLRDQKAAARWPRAELFCREQLADDLKSDCDALLQILERVPVWDPARDRKLQALAALCGKKHGGEKILVFTQYRETAEYLTAQLRRLRVGPVKSAHGQKATGPIAARFSPASNGRPAGRPDEIRVLVATDAMSEGQNLQDARIVVNYDLPWAVIRLTQRAGRVDRLGQKAEEILSYSAIPADGLEKILNLRARLRRRIRQNQEIIGSDERFFHDDESEQREDQKMRDLFAGREELPDDDEGETDLVSRAHEIWRRAVAQNPALEKIIPAIPDVCYAAKTSRPRPDARKAPAGALAYVRAGAARVLAHIGPDGEVRTQSQAEVLQMMECAPDEPPRQIPDNHNDLVRAAAQLARETRDDLGGQLGGPAAPRRRAYDRLSAWLRDNRDTVFAHSAEIAEAKNARQQLHDFPLRDAARRRLRNQLRLGIRDADLVQMILRLHRTGQLCDNSPRETDSENHEPKIICSMGLLP